MKKLMAMVLIITLAASFLGVAVASNEAKANAGLSGNVIIGIGGNYTVGYTATDNVDLQIEWWEPQGDDQITILVNSCNISTEWGGATANVSLSPGYYEIAFRCEDSGIGPTAPIDYNITVNPYTGNYVWPCIQPWLPPQPIPPVEVGGEVYPINKLNILAPWIALTAALIVGTVVVVRRRRAQS